MTTTSRERISEHAEAHVDVEHPRLDQAVSEQHQRVIRLERLGDLDEAAHPEPERGTRRRVHPRLKKLLMNSWSAAQLIPSRSKSSTRKYRDKSCP